MVINLDENIIKTSPYSEMRKHLLSQAQKRFFYEVSSSSALRLGGLERTPAVLCALWNYTQFLFCTVLEIGTALAMTQSAGSNDWYSAATEAFSHLPQVRDPDTGKVSIVALYGTCLKVIRMYQYRSNTEVLQTLGGTLYGESDQAKNGIFLRLDTKNLFRDKYDALSSSDLRLRRCLESLIDCPPTKKGPTKTSQVSNSAGTDTYENLRADMYFCSRYLIAKPLIFVAECMGPALEIRTDWTVLVWMEKSAHLRSRYVAPMLDAIKYVYADRHGRARFRELVGRADNLDEQRSLLQLDGSSSSRGAVQSTKADCMALQSKHVLHDVILALDCCLAVWKKFNELGPDKKLTRWVFRPETPRTVNKDQPPRSSAARVWTELESDKSGK